jgi:hypothetical protein
MVSGFDRDDLLVRAVPLRGGLQAVILSRPWHHARSQLISPLPVDPTPLLDFALDLARGSSGQVRDPLVLSQGGEEGAFVVVGQACSPWAVGWPGQLPAERVGESLLQRPRGQPEPSCLAAVSGADA